MNNPFGLPDELFGAILASAITERVSFFLRVVKRKPNKTNQSCGSNPV